MHANDVRLVLEDADALDRLAEEADDNNWQDWAATMRCAAAHIRLAHRPNDDTMMQGLVEALEPFAAAAEIKLCGEWADDKHFGQTDVGFALTFGDLRRAKAALTKVREKIGG